MRRSPLTDDVGRNGLVLLYPPRRAHPAVPAAARAVGGTHYLVGSVEFNPEDWITHYGE